MQVAKSSWARISCAPRYQRDPHGPKASLPCAQRAQAGGATTKAMTLAQLDALARREVEELGAVIRAAGITLE